MSKKANASTASKAAGSKELNASSSKFGRLSASGMFVVAKQAVKSKRFSEARLMEAVRKVASDRGSKKK